MLGHTLMRDGAVGWVALGFMKHLFALETMLSNSDPSPVLDLQAALALVPAYLAENPDGQRFASLPATEVAQLLVWFDRLGRDPVLQQNVSALQLPEQLVALADESGTPISLSAAEMLSDEIEMLDDTQLDQVTGGSVAIAAIGLTASVVGLGTAAFNWLSTRNNLEIAKVNAGVQTA
jgi:hypothetical protein